MCCWFVKPLNVLRAFVLVNITVPLALVKLYPHSDVAVAIQY